MDSKIYYIMLMVERVCVIATLAFILSRWTWFRKLLAQKSEFWTRVLSIFIFGLIGILGTYTGIVVSTTDCGQNIGRITAISPTEAVINARVLGVAIGGILGGPVVGFFAGLVAGIHRYTLGGFTDLACSLATVWEGLLAGMMAYYWYKRKALSPWQVGFIGLVAEMNQMLVILLVAKPFDRAWELVAIIGVPMILANSIGLMVFFAILQSVMQREQEAVASFAHTALAIADQTLPYFRHGLTEDSARHTAQIIHEMTEVSAVALTDSRTVLAFVGKGADHHIAGAPLQTEITQAVIREGKSYIAENKKRIGCSHSDCPLGAGVVLPLRQRGEVIGTLKLYFDSSADITPSQLELIHGLANLFSSQLELARLDEQERLLADAEIKALQAQVNPHFLFNALNSIVALIRREPTLARQIAVQLGQFLRRNILAGRQQWRTLGEELDHIRDYLTIEAVRFQDKLSVHYDIDERLLSTPAPPLILLPLVENAVKHGISPLNRQGELWLTVAPHETGIMISIQDNGDGMDAKQFKEVQRGITPPTEQGTGFGIYSVIRRMEGIYGSRAACKIESEFDRGTCVTLTFPSGMSDADRERRELKQK
ncbi:sensor histidine kinase [Acetonema longum]|uniref:histidine kinase n=1 Tax=Acetonema longum DSM 6540 TaxID=1009370 RepID=F7NGZ9_9FIRM|nr:sensor histidine kinase [Acetonema longum]EGO64730.1 two-component sensor histidine kinase LytT [Acetonema longum DSM 6540]